MMLHSDAGGEEKWMKNKIDRRWLKDKGFGEASTKFFIFC
jgi:hypothetical protein